MSNNKTFPTTQHSPYQAVQNAIPAHFSESLFRSADQGDVKYNEIMSALLSSYAETRDNTILATILENLKPTAEKNYQIAHENIDWKVTQLKSEQALSKGTPAIDRIFEELDNELLNKAVQRDDYNLTVLTRIQNDSEALDELLTTLDPGFVGKVLNEFSLNITDIEVQEQELAEKRRLVECVQSIKKSIVDTYKLGNFCKEYDPTVEAAMKLEQEDQKRK